MATYQPFFSRRPPVQPVERHDEAATAEKKSRHEPLAKAANLLNLPPANPAKAPDVGPPTDPLLEAVSFLTATRHLALDPVVTAQRLRAATPELSALDKVEVLARCWALLRPEGTPFARPPAGGA